tara:strand:- start:142 stop:327 length:186 start_codon:yes stop_codon:yes gene_type:complete
MSTIKEKINAHLPIVLQLLSTASLVVIALSAICGSKSLKQLAGSHEMPFEMKSQIHHDHLR